MPRILIIEDEVVIAKVLKGYFSQHGLEVLTAATGEEGLAVLLSEKPSLVILDMKLGEGLSGMEVLRRAKAAKSEADFIVVTAVDDQNVTDMAKGLGATDYITKPVSTKDLERVVLSRLKN